MEKILIAAPTHECKKYALIPYLRAVRNLKWDKDDCFFLLVDNSVDEKFSEEIKGLCPNIDKAWLVEHFADMPQGDDREEYRIGHSRERIGRFAIENDFQFWFSLEVDVICPPDTLWYLMGVMRHGLDIVRHGYPARQDVRNQIDAMGCALYRVSILKEISWIEEEKNYVGGDSAFYQWSLEKGLKICNVFNVLNLVHLGA